MLSTNKRPREVLEISPPLGPAHRWSHRDIQRNSCEASTTTDNSNVVEGKPRGGKVSRWGVFGDLDEFGESTTCWWWRSLYLKWCCSKTCCCNYGSGDPAGPWFLLDVGISMSMHCCSASSCCIIICCYMRIIGSWLFHWSYKVSFKRCSLVHWM